MLVLALLACAALVGTARPAAAASDVYQAEDATIFEGAVVANHTGYTGTGFVDYTNVAGSYVQFTATATQAGTATLAFRYANGTTADRPLAVAVNGTTVAAGQSFPSTGSWNTWKTVTVSAPLAAGTNTIRATATTSGGGPNLDSLTVGTAVGTTDWSVAVVDSTMNRFTPATIGGWSYPVGLYLYGQYQVYQRTHDPALLAYIKSWVDRFVDASGNINQTFNSLDSMEAGRLLVVLHHETGDPRYAKASATIVNRLASYPRTSDGGFWHADTSSRAHQLWGDGTFMLNPFLVEYGKEFNDAAYTDAEVVKQLTVYASHLQQPDGLLRHAYDESKTASWADKTTGLSPEVWCRADGWYGMALIDVLDNIPATQPGRAQLLASLNKFAAGLQATQDPASGRWFQVIDKGTQAGNWTETSCSSMFAYTLSRGAQEGYIDSHYTAVAQKAYQGVLARLSVGGDGLTNLTTISIGTNVGDYAYYIGRTQATNDFHGLGSFLIMNEQLTSGK